MSSSSEETRLADLIWQARVARDVLAAANSKPAERAKATRAWVELYRAVHSPRDETAEERIGRLDLLEGLAAEAGIAPLSFYLSEFALDISHEVLVSSDKVNRLGILDDPPRRGRPKRPFKKCIEIAARVEKLRGEGQPLENACARVAQIVQPRICRDAVRRIYEKSVSKEAGAALVRLVAAGDVEL